MKDMKTMAVIVLAGGRGTRIGATQTNKVMMKLGGKPMIGYTADLLKKVGFQKIIIVVGFKKEMIINYLGKGFIYAEQKQPLGTAHAAGTGLKKIPQGTTSVLVINADDSAFYPVKVIQRFVEQHLKEENDLTFLTVEKEDPQVARILRDKNGKILDIIEQQHLTREQKKIKEINSGCYGFKVSFLRKYLKLVPKNPIKGEYYITDLIAIGLKGQARVQAFKMNQGEYFQGVNTKEELKQVDREMRERLKKLEND